VEPLTGTYFFIAVYVLGVTAQGIKACIFGAIVIALIFSDLEERILPDEFTIGGAIAGIVMAIFVRMDFGFAQMLLMQVRNVRIVSVAESVFSAVFCAVALYLVGAAYQRIRHKEGLGFGDVKMVAMIGAFLGLQGALLTMIVGSVLGSVVGLAYIWITRKDMSSYELPFGSFLGLAALLVASYLEIFLKWHAVGVAQASWPVLLSQHFYPR
jgi:leader peptidase (prepilin peptidase)/N-methyltransferase